MTCYLCGWDHAKPDSQGMTNLTPTERVCRNRRMCLVRYLANCRYSHMQPVYDLALANKQQLERAELLGQH